MSKGIHTTCGNTSGPRKTRGLDQYDTPPSAVEPLLQVERLPPKLWEICAGNDCIVNVLRDHGHYVVANDIATDGVNFLQPRVAPPGVGAIVTNPPFILAAEFVAHGLKLVPQVIILERIQFLESDTRADLFDSGKLARVHVFRNRVPRTHLAGWTGNRASPAMMLAWFVFLRGQNVSLSSGIRRSALTPNGTLYRVPADSAAPAMTSMSTPLVEMRRL
jgi:hypothetical protein